MFALVAPQLQAKPSLVGAITLTWNSVAGATGYVLERSASGEAGTFVPLQTLDASERTFRHAGLYYNQKVYYRIKATSGSDASPFSAVVSATTHKQGQVYNIMPFGDSNTEGGSSSVPVSQKAAYRARLEQLLNNSASKGRYDYVGSEQSGSAYVTDTDHAGFGGARNSDLVTLLQKGSYTRWYDNQHMGLDYTANYLEVYKPDVILLHSGTNEISNDGVDNSQQTVEELEEILDEIDAYEKSAGKEVTVILATLIKSVCTEQFCYRGAQYSKNDIIDFYNAKIKTLASKRIGNGDRLILVDMADAGIVYDFTDRGGDMADPLHPALVGYNKMAPVWFKELDKLLSVQPQQPDTQAPETTIASKPAAISNKNTAAFSFTSNESKVQFQVSMDGAAFVTAATPYTHSSLADGEHTLQVRAIDQAGNIDPTPATYTWTIDTKAPAPPVVSAPAEGATLNSNKPTISGTAEAGSAVAVFIGANQVGTATAGADGKWSFVPSTELAEGKQELTAKATDAAGNSSSASGVRTFTVDTQSPETTIAAAPEPVTNSPEATFRFASNKSEVSYQVGLDGAAYRQVQNPYTVNGLA
ncbi:MAG: Ig-like domain-containing protein, partial [Pontibacter sp.]|nr:Ig-like domain-containing protein [Pontibacter sp.]